MTEPSSTPHRPLVEPWEAPLPVRPRPRMSGAEALILVSNATTEQLRSYAAFMTGFSPDSFALWSEKITGTGRPE